MKTEIQILREIVGTINAVRDGYYPFNPARGYSPNDPERFNPNDYAHLRNFYDHITGLSDAAPDVLFEAYYELALAWDKACLKNQKLETLTPDICTEAT
ncbi:MAG: hypothetical protein K1X48_04140 [Burkholderiaceae bacterium]|nr:hypothetical protein [Burkholderiaceae bacterium]